MRPLYLLYRDRPIACEQKPTIDSKGGMAYIILIYKQG
jgi:hypothetical protein